MMNGDFIEFFESQKERRNGTHLEKWRIAVSYFKSFAVDKILFSQLNEAFSEEYADCLLSAPGAGRFGRTCFDPDIYRSLIKHGAFGLSLHDHSPGRG